MRQSKVINSEEKKRIVETVFPQMFLIYFTITDLRPQAFVDGKVLFVKLLEVDVMLVLNLFAFKNFLKCKVRVTAVIPKCIVEVKKKCAASSYSTKLGNLNLSSSPRPGFWF